MIIANERLVAHETAVSLPTIVAGLHVRSTWYGRDVGPRGELILRQLTALPPAGRTPQQH